MTTAIIVIAIMICVYFVWTIVDSLRIDALKTRVKMLELEIAELKKRDRMR